MRRLFLWLSLGLSALASSQAPITITVLHTNDLHARVEPAMIQRKAYGGFARQASLIKRFRESDPNPILLNGGDTFQGTLYFTVYEGLAEAAFMNMAGYQAMAVGNHEFDKGPKTLAEFARLVNFPLLAANLDVSEDPDLKGLVKPSAVIEVGGQKVGVVGAITPDTPSISSPGPTVKFLDLHGSVQKAVDDLKAQGINKIMLVSHVGLSGERRMAREIRGLDVIVGGHSHTLLGNDDFPAGFPGPSGRYPMVENNSEGPCLVVSSWEWGKVLGRLKVDFDAAGKITRWFDAAPVFVDESIPEDPNVKALVEALKKPIANLANEVIGSTPTGLGKAHDGGRGFETTMGNVITDAMLEATKSQGAVAAFTNQGGIRSAIDPGDVTFGAAITVIPFSNTLVVMELTGAEIKAALEHGAERTGGLLHPSILSGYDLDMSQPAGQRVSNVRIGGEPLDLEKTYKVTINSFTASGGDGHEVLKNAKGPRVDTGFVDIDVLVAYFKKYSPIERKLEGRIKQ